MNWLVNNYFNAEAMGFNPHWERWGKGRPSKAKLEKRALYHEWNRLDREQHPEKYMNGMLTLLSTSNDGIIHENGKVKIIYKQRNIQENELHSK